MADIKLTPQQQAVVDNRGGALLVSAAAGSGKTKVLIDRVFKRVTEEQANLDDFLLITFTQAAASELRGKLVKELSAQLAVHPNDRHLQKQMNRVYLAQISTVHAFCGTLLREYAHRLDLPADFHTCDDPEARMLQEQAMQQTLEEAYKTEDAQTLAALDMLGAGRTDAQLPELIRKVYADLQCAADPQKRLQELRQALQVSDCTDVGETCWGAYLLQELRCGLENCIELLSQAQTLIAHDASLAPYMANFNEDIALLRRLSAVQSWEEARTAERTFGRLKTVKKCEDEALKERTKKLRDRAKDTVKKLFQRFAIPSGEALQDLSAGADALLGLLKLTERYSEAYRALKLRRHALDFNDLEHDTLRLLTDSSGAPTAAAREIAERFTEIMVDEYQDTNAVQDSIFRAISKQEQNLFYVGDVKQSIYRFRRADPTIFLKKYRAFSDYREARDGEPRKILLSVNFRSEPAILETANDVFRLTMNERVGGLRYGDDEALRTLSEKTPQRGKSAVELHCIDTEGVPSQPKVRREEIEAEFVAKRIDRMLRGGETLPNGDGVRPIRAGDITILLRSLTGKAEIYVRALQRYGIRCVCGSDNIFQTEEIRLVTALLQIVDNPHQDIPLLTVLLSPIFRVSADLAARLRAQKRSGDIYDTVCASEETTDFVRQLKELRDLAQSGTLRELLDAMDERLFLRQIFSAMEGGAQRISNLDAFFSIADGFETEQRHGLSAFLRYLEVVREKGYSTEAEASSDAVQLMSIHKSKGLEFPVVFLADLGKQFNDEDSKAMVLTDPVLGIAAKVFETERSLLYSTVAQQAISDRIRKEDLSEEMRLLYVAMTRPKNRLVMTYCGGKLQSLLSKLSTSLTIPPAQSTVEEVRHMGDWVLMAALARTEAGELFAVGGNPGCASVSEYPWSITYCSGTDYLPMQRTQTSERTAEQAPLLHPDFLQYPYLAATQAPSKLTATQLKGRTLDEEISEQTVRLPEIVFSKPQFSLQQRPLTPTERGTAIHLAMQYLRYEVCTTPEGVERELKRLVEEKFLTQQQADAVPPKKLFAFFASPLGKRVLSAKQLVREFKFSVLQDASILSGALRGEQVLLQGVTDCCIVEDDGLTILDFKSDRVAPGKEAERGEYYRGQLDAYSAALARIFALPVKERILYFFATDTAVTV